MRAHGMRGCSSVKRPDDEEAALELEIRLRKEWDTSGTARYICSTNNLKKIIVKKEVTPFLHLLNWHVRSFFYAENA
jgi:hypothetical protein